MSSTTSNSPVNFCLPKKCLSPLEWPPTPNLVSRTQLVTVSCFTVRYGFDMALSHMPRFSLERGTEQWWLYTGIYRLGKWALASNSALLAPGCPSTATLLRSRGLTAGLQCCGTINKSQKVCVNTYLRQLLSRRPSDFSECNYLCLRR